MIYRIVRSLISDIKPAISGGILSIDKGEIIFKYNYISNVISSKNAACFLVKNSNFSIENSCFAICAASGGDGSYGNVADISETIVKIRDISSYLCSFSRTQCGDSVFRFLSCGASISSYNSSFCNGDGGSASLVTETNSSRFDINFLLCSSGVNFAFLECWCVILCKQSSFVNSTDQTNYLISANDGCIFDTCYFFQMKAKNIIRNNNVLVNCYADERIGTYDITLCSYSNVALPYLRKPLCKVGYVCSCKMHTSKDTSLLSFIILVMLS